MDDIDTGNYQGVSSNGSGKIVIMFPQQIMSRSQALVHAAWLVAVADESSDNEEFNAVLRAVYNT